MSPDNSQQSSVPTFNPLTEADQIKLIDAVFRILAKTGIMVESESAAALLDGHGASVNHQSQGYRVRLPADLVASCLKMAPARMTFFGREQAFDVTTDNGTFGFAAFGQCVNVLTHDTGILRVATKSDMADSARLQDALPEITIITRTVTTGDQPPASQALHCMDAIVRNSRKHISGGAGDVANLKAIIALLETVAGGEQSFKARPFYTPSICPVSPLSFGANTCEIAIEAAKAGLGVVVMVMPLAGGTGPATLPGTVALALAEQLAGMTLIQLARKGTPVILGSATTIMDLRSAISAMGSPESALINAALAQMARHLGLPSRVACGVSDSKTPDAQVGYEYAPNALAAALSGATIIFGGGGLESGLTHSPAKLLMDHVAMATIRRIAGGLEVTEDALAENVIDQVGPAGNFLMHPHTIAHMREQSGSDVFSRKARMAWEKNDGCRTAAETAGLRAAQLLTDSNQSQLPEKINAELDEIVADFDRRLSRAALI